jgi:predicted transcriptional regulator
MSIEVPTSLNYLRDLNPPELLPPENTSSPSELSEKRRLVLEILERNTSTLEEIEMHISWLQSSPLDSIRHLETDTPVNQNEFTEYIHHANEFITSYQSVIASQSKIVDIITKKFRRTFLAESSPLAESVLESSDNKHNTEIDKHFIKLPKSVIKYTTSNSRNVNEFLDTFLSDLTIALNDTVEIDGNVFAKYLSTAVDDRYRQKRTDFTSEYFTLATSISPRKLTVDEAKEFFRKHFEQHKYTAEPSQRLLSMGMKYDKTFEDYATRVEREVKNSGTNNNSPSILKFLQTTLPPITQTIIQQACIMNHALKWLDVKFGEYKYDDIREWLVECKNIAGKASDYSSPPSFKKLPNSSITFDISSDTTNKRRQTEVQSSNNKGFKKPKLSLDAPSSSSASHTTTQSSDKFQKCNLSNHTTTDCNAPLCQDCEAYYFPKCCPKCRYRS